MSATVTESDCNVLLVAGDEIARYGFGDGHPFGPDRHEAFMRELHHCGLDGRVQRGIARAASREELEWFHTPAYVDLVRERSASGFGYLDAGDTPAWRGVYEAASNVVGATLERGRRSAERAARGAPSFRSPVCITPRAATPPAFACSTTAAWRSRCCGGATA